MHLKHFLRAFWTAALKCWHFTNCQQVSGFKQHHKADYWRLELWGLAVVNQCQGRREVQASLSEMLLSELMVQGLLNLFL